MWRGTHVDRHRLRIALSPPQSKIVIAIELHAPPPAPVKEKERQALDECTFDLSEAPLLLLLSFCHHPLSAGELSKVRKGCICPFCPPHHTQPCLWALSSSCPVPSASWGWLKSRKEPAATQSLASAKKLPPPLASRPAINQSECSLSERCLLVRVESSVTVLQLIFATALFKQR